jgi:acetylornithine aminotransferase/acetylornithine/N-succinyldiaminopimelate aminotransferase
MLREQISPPIVQNQQQRITELFQKNVVPSYGRFELVLDRGEGSYLWDVNGRRYLDLSSGIAVCCLGHASPDITAALNEQSRKLIHVSNLYYTEPQGRLAQELVNLTGPGKVFFSNSGAEANEGLYKVARKFGNDEGRFEIITALNSFHGRTLASIAATGQEKVKRGFGPATPGFRHVPYNDLEAVREAISPATVAVLIECIQGESGITPARADYLLGLRQLCDEKRMLLLLDEVQGSYFRTGHFASYQRILEGHPGSKDFLPDGVSWAKSIAGGFPLGGFWVRAPYADLLSAGTHGTTFGGSPLGCAVGLKVLEVIRRDRLDENARKLGAYMIERLEVLAQKYPTVLREIRGFGFIIGMELAPKMEAFAKSDKPYATQFVNALHAAGVMTVPAGPQVTRILPALNVRKSEADEGLLIIEQVVASLA